MGFGRYLAYRLFNAALILFFVVLLTSILFVKLADVTLQSQIQETVQAEWNAYAQHHPGSNVNQSEFIKKRMEYWINYYGLNKPYRTRVWQTTIKTLKFDFGQTRQTIFGTRDASEIIKIALPRTILLFTTAQIIVILIGILLGVKSAQKPGSTVDRTISVLAMITASLPMWWFGMVMILIFAFKLSWFPVNSFPDPTLTGLAHIKDVMWRMVLPVITIVTVLFGGWAWTTRNIMIGTMQEDFIMAARAKGVPERKVIYGHALRAAAPPIVTMTIFGLLGSLGGAIITEAVFNWPGMGRLYWIALQQNETTLIVGLTYIFTLLYLTAMILADLAYAFLDPRVKVGASASM
ncbi:ABC transporter permease [Thermococcus gorgonarius]|uniref:Peptide ABC transporter permease n=1 Tax=Thermococcus gorgonarius TaxID=71997 RepID=A0A2Z2M7R6_THEGO|nr:ABC transporter permease [Thermococcus gorgonarius]ASJ01353.1 peptide ABC transporter permease [Thermococcus gorgonarius]